MGGAPMAKLEIVEVPLTDRKLVERFIRVPWHIHRELYPNDHWVPPLLMDRRDYLNPLLRARRRRPVDRAGARA